VGLTQLVRTQCIIYVRSWVRIPNTTKKRFIWAKHPKRILAVTRKTPRQPPKDEVAKKKNLRADQKTKTNTKPPQPLPKRKQRKDPPQNKKAPKTGHQPNHISNPSLPTTLHSIGANKELAPPHRRNNDVIGVYERTTSKTEIGSSSPNTQSQSVYPKKLGHFGLS